MLENSSSYTEICVPLVKTEQGTKITKRQYSQIPAWKLFLAKKWIGEIPKQKNNHNDQFSLRRYYPDCIKKIYLFRNWPSYKRLTLQKSITSLSHNAWHRKWDLEKSNGIGYIFIAEDCELGVTMRWRVWLGKGDSRDYKATLTNLRVEELEKRF